MRAIPKGYVYFVLARDCHRVKIGYSSDHPDGRLLACQTASPVTLERLGFLRGGYDLERRLHHKFRRFRAHGEWFYAFPDLMDFIHRKALRWPPLATSVMFLKRCHQYRDPYVPMTEDEWSRYFMRGSSGRSSFNPVADA
jgi:hypothetical protein